MTMTLSKSIDRVLSRLEQVQRNGSRWSALCPAHEDHSKSLSISEGDDGRCLINCFAGCSTEEVVRAMGLEMKDLFLNNTSAPYFTVSGVNVLTLPEITLEQLAEVKCLPVDFLASLGWRTIKRKGNPAIEIPYKDKAGNVNTIRYRVAFTGHRFEYRSGDKVMLYGLDQLPKIQQHGWCLIVEGETDCATCWYFKLPCIGVPGKDIWKPEWSKYLSGLDCYIWQEPGAESFSEKLGSSLPNLKVIKAPEGIKDISEAHIQGNDLRLLLEHLLVQATPFSDIHKEHRATVTKVLGEKATPVLSVEDPLVLVEKAIRDLGYGGDVGPALIIYLAATSRLLGMRPGLMPVHILLVGPTSAGKSYTLSTVLQLLPPEAYHKIDASSPRVLIYDDADLQHHLLVFNEADSLPAGEDNPVASAIRNLLQDHHLNYQVTVRDPDTGNFTVKKIDKPGPTVMITTATRRLGAQLDSRLFSLEVPDSQEQMRCALEAQAKIEMLGVAEPSEALVSFQGYLQSLAPWEVVVPFANKLAKAIGDSPVSARATRDYSRILSLVKSVAVIRHAYRQRDEQGRLIARVDDYATVINLVGDMYASSATGASEKVIAAVFAVKFLLDRGREKITVSDVARELGVNNMAASRRVTDAIKGRWLTNSESRNRAPANLSIGEPLPAKVGLPIPEDLVKGYVNTLTPLTDRESRDVNTRDVIRIEEGQGGEWGEEY